jgi:hypothetical protein
VNRIQPAVLLQRERAVAANPNDMCARGDLISHAWEWTKTLVTSRYDHLLWMIANHPDWDGFYLTDAKFFPHGHVEFPFLDGETQRFGEIKQAWIEAADRNPKKAIVLYNAGMFFAVLEPERAVVLLRRRSISSPRSRFFAVGWVGFTAMA